MLHFAVFQMDKRMEELSRQLIKEKKQTRRDKITVLNLQREVARAKSEGPLVSLFFIFNQALTLNCAHNTVEQEKFMTGNFCGFEGQAIPVQEIFVKF